MALLSAKYIYIMLISIFITALSFEIGIPVKKVDTFEETMNALTAQSHVSLELAKMRVDTLVSRTIRENQ